MKMLLESDGVKQWFPNFKMRTGNLFPCKTSYFCCPGKKKKRNRKRKGKKENKKKKEKEKKKNVFYCRGVWSL